MFISYSTQFGKPLVSSEGSPQLQNMMHILWIGQWTRCKSASSSSAKPSIQHDFICGKWPLASCSSAALHSSSSRCLSRAQADLHKMTELISQVKPPAFQMWSPCISIECSLGYQIYPFPYSEFLKPSELYLSLSQPCKLLLHRPVREASTWGMGPVPGDPCCWCLWGKGFMPHTGSTNYGRSFCKSVLDPWTRSPGRE